MDPERGDTRLTAPHAAPPSDPAGPRPAGVRASRRFVPELDAMRGWAILLVVLYHADFAIFGAARDGTDVSPLVAFMTAGHTGVTLFFVLSAYLLWRPFLSAAAGGAPVRTGDFFRRRALRILPLYGAAVLVAVSFCLGDSRAVSEGLQALTFWTSFSGTPQSLLPYSAVWWSLATEVQFYLLLPLLGFGLISRVGRIAVVALGALWAVTYATIVLAPDTLSLGNRLQAGLSVIGRAPAFLAGMGAAWLAARHGDGIRQRLARPSWLRHGGADLVLAALLLLLGLWLAEVTRRGFYAAEIQFVVWHWAESVLWASLLLWLLLAPLRLRRWIAHPAVERIGVLSYSIYLVHYPILHALVERSRSNGLDLAGDVALRIGLIAVGLALCFLVSSLTYAVIERPFLVRKARIDG